MKTPPYSHLVLSISLFIYSRAHIFKASVCFTKFCDAVFYGHKYVMFHKLKQFGTSLSRYLFKNYAITESSGGSSWLRVVGTGTFPTLPR